MSGRTFPDQGGICPKSRGHSKPWCPPSGRVCCPAAAMGCPGPSGGPTWREPTSRHPCRGTCPLPPAPGRRAGGRGLWPEGGQENTRKGNPGLSLGQAFESCQRKAAPGCLLWAMDRHPREGRRTPVTTLLCTCLPPDTPRMPPSAGHFPPGDQAGLGPPGSGHTSVLPEVRAAPPL